MEFTLKKWEIFCHQDHNTWLHSTFEIANDSVSIKFANTDFFKFEHQLKIILT